MFFKTTLKTTHSLTHTLGLLSNSILNVYQPSALVIFLCLLAFCLFLFTYFSWFVCPFEVPVYWVNVHLQSCTLVVPYKGRKRERVVVDNETSWKGPQRASVVWLNQLEWPFVDDSSMYLGSQCTERMNYFQAYLCDYSQTILAAASVRSSCRCANHCQWSVFHYDHLAIPFYAYCLSSFITIEHWIVSNLNKVLGREEKSGSASHDDARQNWLIDAR